MNHDPSLSARLRVLLVQALERHHPGCGAYTKFDQASGAAITRWRDHLPTDIEREMRAFSAGWAAASAAWASELRNRGSERARGNAPAMPRRPGGPRTAQAHQGARARLESLFKEDEKTS
ncbi:Uncharacterised protein [Bordetella ansorpii]|uniref:Uncharacterized protein n=1 Tax=Bordetella ansorpii TaxID=288768 RepID=A0A157SKR4_9BORD|nr:hypothetical protein [Bordetella ansorpii]SAI70486.1 Uncharacterised protein [Bordetella ansorpii]